MRNQTTTTEQYIMQSTLPLGDLEENIFADYTLDWLETVKHRIELITYISYANAVKGRIAPYFQEKGITLLELKPHHIQEFYSHALNEWGVSANTVIHYHANIRSALQQAYSQIALLLILLTRSFVRRRNRLWAAHIVPQKLINF
ncbi:MULTISPECIES: hypothetical protein [unclassified Paenibacillus]|uniref:hypothetical protein n=1 Tax=unclassified Paenibacillus TaxID=185978 RepID=UPI001C0F4F31|nr:MULTISPECIES: hypothetical protein [unclassified Paenibacillus]MBU5442438.1 hypothetical protein [Paenibacillus sp. MSJ-34]CAH0122658.1 hypothetical protein PAE9249_05230 [Paenibacillus sp. CECT 9249]